MIPYKKRPLNNSGRSSFSAKRKSKNRPGPGGFHLKKDGGDMSHLTPIMINGEAGKITSDLC